MAYEELDIYAIQFKDVKSFPERFRCFSSRSERDSTIAFLKEKQPAAKSANLEPVRLKVIVKTDNIEQLALKLSS